MIYIVSNQLSLYDSFEGIEYKDISFCIQYFLNKKIIGVDTETNGFSPHTRKLLLVQLGDEENQFVLDDTIDFRLLKPILEDESKTFIFHNAKFDLRFFLHLGIIIKNVFDTYLAEKLLYLGYPSGMHRMGLADCSLRYLDVTMDKSVRGAIHREHNSERVINYAATDVKYLIPIREAQMALLIEKDLVVAAEVEFKFVVVLSYVEYCGLYLDVDKWKAKMEVDKTTFLNAEKALNKWVLDNNCDKFVTKEVQGDLFLGFPEKSCSISWTSPKQVIPFFESLGFTLEVKDKDTGGIKKSVEAPIIKRQEKLSPVAELYLNYKQAEKILTTYGDTFIKQVNPITNRIHTQFTQLMDTSRLSSGGKDKDTNTETINLQNIPSDSITRGCFTAQEGNVLIDCDYSSQEDVIFTELSRESKLIEFYNSTNARDGHSFVAKMCFPEELGGIEESEVKERRPDLRKRAKTAKFALHYGGNGLTVSRNLNLSNEVGIAIEKAYFKGFPGIAAYFKKVKAEAWHNGYILISKRTGHKCFIHDWLELKEIEKTFTSNFWETYRVEKEANSTLFIEVLQPKVSNYYKRRGDIDRMALNYPVQGSSAIVTKLASIYFFDYLCKNNLVNIVLMSNLVHDECLVECPKPLAKDTAIELQRCMEHAGKVFCKVVTLKAIPEISDHWTH